MRPESPTSAWAERRSDRPGTGKGIAFANAFTPPEWEINPSSWPQRIPIVALSLLGFLIASYLTLFQIGAFESVWEPFFGEGSRVILNSRISRILPVPDAAMGALGYLLDPVTGLIGGRDRWRTMPWMVILFGLAVGPLGVVSIMLVILQPILFDTWCTLCLASALISLAMVGPALDEVLASLQHMPRVARRRERRPRRHGHDPGLHPARPAGSEIRRRVVLVAKKLLDIRPENEAADLRVAPPP